MFASGPGGSTPALKRLQASFAMHKGRKVARYFFGDGVPDGGESAIKTIEAMVRKVLCLQSSCAVIVVHF